MNSHIQSGHRLPYSNTGAAILSGAVVVLTAGNAGMIGVAVTDIAAATGTGEVEVSGVKELTALNTDTGAVGTDVYWDATNSRITTTATANTYGGKLARAKTNGQTTAHVLLNRMPGR